MVIQMTTLARLVDMFRGDVALCPTCEYQHPHTSLTDVAQCRSQRYHGLASVARVFPGAIVLT